MATRNSVPRERYKKELRLAHRYHVNGVLQENYSYLREKLSQVCAKHGERVLDTPHNPISLGLL